MKNTCRISQALTLGILLCGIAASRAAFAGAADYIYTPAVEYGEREIDTKIGATSPQAGARSQAASIGFGLGAREYWFTEVYLKQERTGSDIANIAEWENKFQLTDTGKYPVDVGLITELEAPLSANAPWSFKLGPLFQTDFDRLQLNANLLFERPFGKSDEGGAPYSTLFSYQWQAKYRWRQKLEFGLQALGELGKWDDWNRPSEQSHRVGPAVFGKVVLANRRAVKYNAAWLFGTSRAAPSSTFRMQVEYEF